MASANRARIRAPSRSVLAHCPVARAKSRTCRGLITTTGSPTAASAPINGTSSPPVASSTIKVRCKARSRSTACAMDDSQTETLPIDILPMLDGEHVQPVGHNTAVENPVRPAPVGPHLLFLKLTFQWLAVEGKFGEVAEGFFDSLSGGLNETNFPVFASLSPCFSDLTALGFDKNSSVSTPLSNSSALITQPWVSRSSSR